MLTESEKEWLKTRDKKRPYCFYCEALFGADSCYWKCVTESCAMYPDMKDAARFSERVAAKLATVQANSFPAMVEAYKYRQTIGWANLKLARLAVEEEMDAEIQAKD